jgi:hypothetical protein
MQSLSKPDRAERLADLVLQHRLAQRFSFQATAALIDSARGSTDIDPDAADQVVQKALEAVVTAEILATRQAGATAEAA